jgi:hypothetical protein
MSSEYRIDLRPRGDRAMRVRFWGGITRGQEKWVKRALGYFWGD